jgi:uncharacterized membrane protein YphA (DoxX/SURF4 family)
MDRFLNPIYIGALIASAFFAVLFLQSGLDKVFDWKGNAEWLGPHFAKTPMKNMVPLLLGAITVMEVATGALAAVAGFMILFNVDAAQNWYTAAIGLAALTLTMLFAGQRIAKDYVGASTLAIYFGVALVALALSQPLAFPAVLASDYVK